MRMNLSLAPVLLVVLVLPASGVAAEPGEDAVRLVEKTAEASNCAIALDLIEKGDLDKAKTLLKEWLDGALDAAEDSKASAEKLDHNLPNVKALAKRAAEGLERMGMGAEAKRLAGLSESVAAGVREK